MSIRFGFSGKGQRTMNDDDEDALFDGMNVHHERTSDLPRLGHTYKHTRMQKIDVVQNE